MHYVKQFNINGVDTKQVACIELRGKPNAATEGHVGVLGIDVTSPTHDVYKCVAINGNIYTWELLSSGMSIISATDTGDGFINKSFAYSNLLIPNGYIIKPGDLILDSCGYLYQVKALGIDSCDATYSGTQFGVGSEAPGVAAGIRTINDALLKFFVGTFEEYSKLTAEQKQNLFAIITDDTAKEEIENAIKTLEKNYATLTTGLDSCAKKSDLTNGTITVKKASSATSATTLTPGWVSTSEFQYQEDLLITVPFEWNSLYTITLEYTDADTSTCVCPLYIGARPTITSSTGRYFSGVMQIATTTLDARYCLVCIVVYQNGKEYFLLQFWHIDGDMLDENGTCKMKICKTASLPIE